MAKRYFAKQHNTDANQPAIIKALEKIGCCCYEMEKPVDLLVEDTISKAWFVIEVKNPKGKNRLTEEQKIFFKKTTAPASVIRSGEEAVRFVHALRCQSSE